MTRCLVFPLRGLGAFTYGVSRLWASWRGGHWDDDVGDGSVVSAQFLGLCRLFKGLSFGVLFLHFRLVGVDNLGVVRHVGRLLDGQVSSRPCELLPDGVISFYLLRGCCTFVG